jgi:hypothetical protein
MNLERYWLPKNDTGFGFHYFPDTEHYSPYDLQRWLPEVKRMGASWLVLLSALDIPVPEFFIRELVTSEIEPVVRVVAPAVQPIGRSELAELLQVYAEWGVHYVEVFHEANSASRWPLPGWTRPSLVEGFVDLLAPCLEEMQRAGLYPFFPALQAGGNYWDLSFLQTALEHLISRDKRSLFDRMVVGMHNHTLDKPLAWGQGGRDHWPMARPYFTPNGSEDHRGYNLFEWYDGIIQATVGHSLPLICMGSAVTGDPYSSAEGVWADEESRAERSLTIANMCMDGSTPDYVLNHAFWLLATKEGHPSRVHAWYGPQGEESRAVSAMKGLLKRPRPRNGDDSTPPTQPPSDEDGDVEFVGLSQQMIETLNISGPRLDTEPYWKVVRVEVQPNIHNMSAFAVTDAEAARFFWPDGEYVTAPKDDPLAPAGARHQAASMPMFSDWGGYSVEVVGNSEILQGFGLYGNDLELAHGAHHPVIVVFRLVEPGGPPSPPAPPGPPNPPSPPQPPTAYDGFPRPPGDNGMGIHFGLDTRSEAIALDIRRAQEMKITWATLCYQGDEQLLRCARMIWDAGIMPVCRQVTTIGIGHPFERDARSLVENGIPAYIQIYNEPSDEREWERAQPRDYTDKWAHLWALKATEVHNAGGYPGLQCLHPKELEAAIDALGVDNPVWRRVWFCSHNYGLNHPPDWQEDYWSVLGFQFFAEMFNNRLGFVPPIICGEGGWLYGAYDDHRYPRVDGDVHARYTREMYEWFRTGRLSDGKSLPDYLFAVCPWILSGPTDEAWYGFTTKVATIQAVKDISHFARARSKAFHGEATNNEGAGSFSDESAPKIQTLLLSEEGT